MDDTTPNIRVTFHFALCAFQFLLFAFHVNEMSATEFSDFQFLFTRIYDPFKLLSAARGTVAKFDDSREFKAVSNRNVRVILQNPYEEKNAYLYYANMSSEQWVQVKVR